MEFSEEEELKHYGVIRRSGRYPWGSGGNAYQSAVSFKAELDDLRAQGLTDAQIKQAMGISSSTEFRDQISLSREIIRSENVAMANRLKNEKQMSTRAIAKRMLGSESKESTVRGWLQPTQDLKDRALATIAGLLKGHLGTKKWLDVGKGNNLHMGVSETKFRAALRDLQNEGHPIFSIKVPQLGTDKLTELKVLGQPGSTKQEAREAVKNGVVYTILDKSLDGGLTFTRPKDPPVSVSSNKIQVRYAEDGGDMMDGVIELRRGVPELDLGSNRYAQVRVAVDGTHYLKGMAIYADDLPAGTNIRFNTSKSKANSLSKLDAMKELKTGITNVNNPFGATVRPMIYEDANGEKHTSALNLVYKEGDWDNWSRNLSSQILSKQSLSLAATQLGKAQKKEEETFNEIMALTNPVLKKKMLLDYAKEVDSKAVSLKAAALPRQSSHVILPMNSMRPNEIYAPNFNDGERVALIRHPHSGPFEIPQLTVNNKNTTAKRIMGSAKDAVGIHYSVAEQLSGADFDGDSVLVIPNNSKRIKSRDPLEELKGFNPREAYPETPGMQYMKKGNVQKEMGTISNLITDMTIKGAEPNEIAKAVKHSMVVIDAEKHKLNYKQSERDNSIKMLKTRYQTNPEDPRKSGASTLISRASSTIRPPQYRLKRQSEGGPINPETGELQYVETGKTRTIVKEDKRTGETVTKEIPLVTKTTRMAYTNDAYTLSSGRPMENIYAEHANALKSLANEARKEAIAIKDPTISKAAKAAYTKEVASLKAKLKIAQSNAPLERRAQIVGNATARAVIDANPELDKDQVKRVKYQSLQDARIQVGADKQRIGTKDLPLTEREWYAIQSGAVSTSVLTEVLNNSDIKAIKELATPRPRSSLTAGQLALAKTMANSGRSLSEISAALGIPRSTISDNLNK